ncbi:GTP-binding protein [Aquibacillus rhizosphaerae]|uniref:GTP-binding protein n=1 Tax=Aquibacillus rhizosphaerae TaxID=3051431 RepID=A0ABT7L384_9BACI|nr:GTP-binding protein [Aquibacillus sp. LR5S19]MDL4839854.1 GTP-binding protein [Aquibacillus sp. LR5S19]
MVEWLEGWPSGIVRKKECFWVALRNDVSGMLSQARTSLSIQDAGEWMVIFPEQERIQFFDERELAER